MEEFDVWITKYALTRGILIETVRATEDPKVVATYVKERLDSVYVSPDWHRDLKDAQKRARAMRDKVYARLLKQTKALKALRFGD